MRFFVLLLAMSIFLQANAFAGTGILEVNSSPSGAKVYIDGIYVGNTPYFNLEIPTGQHAIKVWLNDDYSAQEATVNIDEITPIEKKFTFRGRGGGRLTGVDEEIEVAKYVGDVVFASVPLGAEVLVNGERLPKKTPFGRKGIDVGEYMVEFRMNSKSLKGKFEVIKDETVKLIADFNTERIMNKWEEERLLQLKKQRELSEWTKKEVDRVSKLEEEGRRKREKEGLEEEERMAQLKKCSEFDSNRWATIRMPKAVDMVGKVTKNSALISDYIYKQCNGNTYNLNKEIYAEVYNLKGYNKDLLLIFYNGDARVMINGETKVTSSKSNGYNINNTGKYGDCYYHVKLGIGANYWAKKSLSSVTVEFTKKECRNADKFERIY